MQAAVPARACATVEIAVVAKGGSANNEENGDGKGAERSDRGSRSDRNDRGDRGQRNNRNDRNNRGIEMTATTEIATTATAETRSFQNQKSTGLTSMGCANRGVIEVQQEGHAFLRSADYNYLNSPDDVYVSAKQLKQFGLQTGDTVVAGIRPPRIGENTTRSSMSRA